MNDSPDVMESILKLFRMIKRNGRHDHRLPCGSFRLLQILKHHDGIRTSDLAEKLDIRPASLTDLIKKLERTGYLYRQQDEHDFRVYRVHATAKAKSEFAQHQKIRQAQSQALSACLTPQELATFCATCSKLIEHLKSHEFESLSAPSACPQKDPSQASKRQAKDEDLAR